MNASVGIDKSKKIVDIKEAIEGQKFNGFLLGMMILSFVILMIDGYDMLSISYIIPAIAKSWGIQASLFGPMLAIGNIGLMVGAILFGFVGDKFGRKVAIIVSTLVFALFSLACAFATNLTMLLVLRVLASIGIGGLQPVLFVLNSDFASARSKIKRVAIIFVGANIGGAIGGVLASKLLPSLGWQSMFIIGGVAPLVVLIAILLWLPESISWLAANNKANAKILPLIKKLRPDLDVTAETQFVIAAENKTEKTSFAKLFAGKLAYITPMLWVCFIFAQGIMLFCLNWMPTILVNSGLSISSAALLTSILPASGILGSILVGPFLDKAGYKWAAIVPLLAFIVLTPLGFVFKGPLPLFNVLIGLTIAANYAIMPALVPLFYPVNNRSNASGTAISVSKIGAIVAPLIGGAMIAAGMPPTKIFVFIALPLLVSTVLLFLLGGFYKKDYASKE